PETAKTLASYDDPFFGKYPAITENKFGKGSFIYEGCLISDEIQSKIIAVKAKEIGLVDDKQIVYPVVARSGINDQGKTIRYYLNYSDKEQSAIYNFDKGTDLLTNKALKKGDSLSLKPWDVLIVEE
ncbi:MAG: beta-galactosidase trimerization domain-containing protein, partial [Ferruginibacter sp.]